MPRTILAVLVLVVMALLAARDAGLLAQASSLLEWPSFTSAEQSAQDVMGR